MIRLIGSPLLIVLAALDRPVWLAAFLVFLVFTEWADGFLARRFSATSPLGARLDTIADAVLYSCLLVSVIVLKPELIRGEIAWIALAIGSYACSWLVSWWKFRHLPSYHTLAAKGVWILVGAGVLCLVTGVSPWPFRFAMVCVSIANLEAILITLTLNELRVDILSLWHARRLKRDG